MLEEFKKDVKNIMKINSESPWRNYWLIMRVCVKQKILINDLKCKGVLCNKLKKEKKK